MLVMSANEGPADAIGQVPAAVPAATARTAASTIKKKMFHNCDHCRSAKRACDAKYDSITQALQTRVACSNCRRKGKTCTFNHLISTFGVAEIDLVGIKKIERALAEPTSDSRPDKRRRSDDSDDYEAADEEISRGERAVLVRQARGGARQASPPLAYCAAGNRLTTNFDRIFLNSDLVSIYEGAAEQALRCWVTNVNTPYLFDTDNSNDPFKGKTMHWKVCVLDQGTEKLFRGSSNRPAASEKVIREALHATMLAFAAQWPRHRQKMGDKTGLKPSEWQPDEARIRVELWKTARDKLMAAADEPASFRVAFALILFAWTEKPKEVPNHAHWEITDASVQTSLYENSAVEASSWQDPAEASTMMLATASRKLLTFRNKLQSLVRRGIDPWSVTQTTNRSAPLDAEQLQRRQWEAALLERTYHNLYWLCAMIDCETSVLRKHPPVICDDDTDLVQLSLLSVGAFGPPRKIWDDVILSSSIQRAHEFVRSWPAREEDALKTLAFSAPVKVLLFRHIGRLQAAYWRQADSATVERHIRQGLEVVSHWEQAYQPFIESCIASHSILPPYIRSWYTLITAPWNLAVLMLVELAQTVDQAYLSDPQARRRREQGETFSTLRRKACNQTAALIHAVQVHEQQRQLQSAMDSIDAFSFVHATGGTVLHTEPWAEIMVNSFFATAKSEIRLFNGLAANFQWQELECSKHRVEKYLWALDQLSNRSHLAELAYREVKTMAEYCTPGGSRRSASTHDVGLPLSSSLTAAAHVPLTRHSDDQSPLTASLNDSSGGISASPGTALWQECLAAFSSTPFTSDPASYSTPDLDISPLNPQHRMPPQQHHPALSSSSSASASASAHRPGSGASFLSPADSWMSGSATGASSGPPPSSVSPFSNRPQPPPLSNFDAHSSARADASHSDLSSSSASSFLASAFPSVQQYEPQTVEREAAHQAALLRSMYELDVIAQQQQQQQHEQQQQQQQQQQRHQHLGHHQHHLPYAQSGAYISPQFSHVSIDTDPATTSSQA